jgi:tetratricopeptide (TPR) repeat protein
MRLKAAAFGLAVMTACPPAVAQESYTQVRALSLFNQLVEPGNCESTLPVAREFWRTREFSEQLALGDQESFLAAVIQCAMTLEDGQEAISAVNAAYAIGASWASKARLELALSYEDNALVSQAFFDLARTMPKDFEGLEAYNSWGALRIADRFDDNGDTALRMHEALVAANYTPREFYHDDFYRMDHARLLLLRGRVEEARARLEGVIDPRAITVIRVSRLYDPLRTDPAFEQRLDVSAAAELAIARARRAVSENPRQLSLIVQLASLLRDMGRSSEALTLIDEILPIAQGAEAATRFDDLDQQLNWVLFAKADLLYDLGRNREAQSIYSQAMNAGELGRGNIILTFAGMLNAEGRGADALQVLEMLGRLTDYADTWMQSERACAAHLVGNTAVRDEAMAAIRANEGDNASSHMHALLCVNDLDGAAALMIRRLGNPVEREGALMAMQPYRRIETRQMPMEVEELRRLAEVTNRPDVRAAIDAAGRLEPTPIYSN